MLTDPERLPAALITDDDGEPLRIRVPCGDDDAQRAAVAGGRRPRAADPDGHRAARERQRHALDHLAALRRGPGHAAGAVRAARARRRRGARGGRRRPGRRAPQRGPRRVRDPRAGARARRRRLRGRARTCAPGDDLHHPHARPGGQRHLPARPGAAGAGPLHGRERARRRRDHPPRPHPPRRRAASRSASPSSRCAPAAPPTASASATARSRARCGRTWICRSATSPTASTSRPGSASRCAALLDRHLGEGWATRPRTRTPGPAWTTRPTRSCGPCAPSSARRLVDWVRERSTIDRLTAATPATSSSRRPTSSTRTC